MIIGVGSKSGGVGSSFIASQLSHALALKRCKTLLLTTDYINGVQYSCLSEERRRKDIFLEKSIFTNEKINLRENLDFIDMIYSKDIIKISEKYEAYSKIKKFLQQQRNEYDYTIIDYKSSSDNLEVNKRFLENTDKMILVNDASDSYRKGILNMLKEIENYSQMEILCVLFNGIEKKFNEELEDKISLIKSLGIYVPVPITKEKSIYDLIKDNKTIWESNDRRLKKMKESFLQIINRIEQVKKMKYK